MGMLQVPLEAGYSVIGWNHPGFWGSTGSPFPRQDANAADAVMQFAINNLGFPVEKIVIYGWSIGGYTTSWIAMNYPSVHAVVGKKKKHNETIKISLSTSFSDFPFSQIVDATFDHITPLAIEKMPSFLESTVRQAVSDNFNLNVAEQLAEYPGPVRLIKRAKDEMITTE